MGAAEVRRRGRDGLSGRYVAIFRGIESRPASGGDFSRKTREREKKYFYICIGLLYITSQKEATKMNPEYEEFEERYFGGDYAAFCDEYGPETEAD